MDRKVKAAILCLLLFALGIPIGRNLGGGEPAVESTPTSNESDSKERDIKGASSRPVETKREPNRIGTSQRPTFEGLLVQRAKLGEEPFLAWLAGKLETMERRQVQKMGRELRDMERREFHEMADARVLIHDWLIENHPKEVAIEFLAEAQWERDLEFGDEDVDLEHEAGWALAALADTEPETVKQLIRGMHNTDARREVLTQLDDDMSFEAAQLMAEIALEVDPEHAYEAVGIAFVARGKKNAAAAIEAAGEITDKDNQVTALVAVAEGYASEHPREAVQWARSHHDKSTREKILTSALRHAARADLETGKALARELVAANELTGHANIVGSLLAQIDAEIAHDWFINHGTQTNLHWRAAAATTGTIAKQNPALALDLARRVPDSEKRQTIGMQTSIQWRSIPYEAVLAEIESAMAEKRPFDPERAYVESRRE